MFDGGGLYSEVMASGSKFWRQKYRFNHRESRISNGPFPFVSLLTAREEALQVKDALRSGSDPAFLRRHNEQIRKIQNETFETVAFEWGDNQLGIWTARYAQAVLFGPKKYVFPDLGSYPASKMTPLMMLTCLQRIEHLKRQGA